MINTSRNHVKCDKKKKTMNKILLYVGANISKPAGRVYNDGRLNFQSHCPPRLKSIVFNTLYSFFPPYLLQKRVNQILSTYVPLLLRIASFMRCNIKYLFCVHVCRIRGRFIHTAGFTLLRVVAVNNAVTSYIYM